jgi:hypothetical protein
MSFFGPSGISVANLVDDAVQIQSSSRDETLYLIVSPPHRRRLGKFSLAGYKNMG